MMKSLVGGTHLFPLLAWIFGSLTVRWELEAMGLLGLAGVTDMYEKIKSKWF
jgi:hypothetical protein